MGPVRLRRRSALLMPLAVVALVLGLAPGASAHVTVNPDEATRGSYAKLTFRVPTERDDAATVKLQVFFPADHPVQSVSVKPHPGWRFHVDTRQKAVREITWRADSPADAIEPGEFDEFAISLGPLPDAHQMVFKALQTYSDGEVVRWIDLAAKGEPEPEHPAPVLALTPPATAQPTDASVTAGAPTGDGAATAALALSIAALVVALGGTGVALRNRLRH